MSKKEKILEVIEKIEGDRVKVKVVGGKGYVIDDVHFPPGSVFDVKKADYKRMIEDTPEHLIDAVPTDERYKIEATADATYAKGIHHKEKAEELKNLQNEEHDLDVTGESTQSKKHRKAVEAEEAKEVTETATGA